MNDLKVFVEFRQDYVKHLVTVRNVMTQCEFSRLTDDVELIPYIVQDGIAKMRNKGVRNDQS